MSLVDNIFFAAVLIAAATPAYFIARMRSLDHRSLPVRLFVCAGATVMFLGPAFFVMLIVFSIVLFQVFGIDMLD